MASSAKKHKSISFILIVWSTPSLVLNEFVGTKRLVVFCLWFWLGLNFMLKPYKFTYNSTAQTGNTTVWHWRFQLPKRSYHHLCHDGLSFGLNFMLKPYKFTHNSTAQTGKTTVWQWRFQLPKRSYRHLCRDGLSFGFGDSVKMWLLNGEWPDWNQIYLVMLIPTQFTQASFLQKIKCCKMVFWHF